MSARDPLGLSIVAPACNEEEVIADVLRSWAAVLDRLSSSWEIIITDDGSTDRTGDILASLTDEIPGLRVVRFGANRGYGPALAAAIAGSRGEIVVTIDSDGQFDLADAEKLVDLLEGEHLDAVTGYRMGKKDAFIKVVADRVLNLLVNLICGVRFKDNNCALKAVRGPILRALPLSTCWLTPSEILVRMAWDRRAIGQVGVAHRPRAAGRSKIHVIVAQCARLVGVMVHLRMERYYRRHKMLFSPEPGVEGSRGRAAPIEPTGTGKGRTGHGH